MNLIFLGPPGAGKGTQAAMVAAKYGIPHISTGDMLRGAIAQGTEMGLAAKAYMDQGELVPDEVVIGVVRDRLAQRDCAKGFILDGFPRTVVQAETLAGIVSIDHAILVDLDDESIVARMAGRRTCPACQATYHIDSLGGSQTCAKCGATLIQRTDDAPETVRNRLAVYHQKTQPLVDYYEGAGVLARIDGSQTIDAVFQAICGLLGAVR